MIPPLQKPSKCIQNILTFFIFLLFTSCVKDSKPSQSGGADRTRSILNGTADNDHKAVGLLRSELPKESPQAEQRYKMCTATLFCPPDAPFQGIVTAKHCIFGKLQFTNENPGTINSNWVNAGSPKVKSPDDDSGDAIQFARLDSKLVPHMPIISSPQNILMGNDIIISGYGTGIPLPVSTPRYRLQGTMLSEFDMNDADSNLTLIKKSNKIPQDGDSGGPAIWNGENAGVYSSINTNTVTGYVYYKYMYFNESRRKAAELAERLICYNNAEFRINVNDTYFNLYPHPFAERWVQVESGEIDAHNRPYIDAKWGDKDKNYIKIEVDPDHDRIINFFPLGSKITLSVVALTNVPTDFENNARWVCKYPRSSPPIQPYEGPPGDLTLIVNFDTASKALVECAFTLPPPEVLSSPP